MNKLLTKIVGVVLGTTMAVGVGVGVAVNSDRKTVDSEVEAAGPDSYSLSITKDNLGEFGSSSSGYAKYNGSGDYTASGTNTNTMDVTVTQNQMMIQNSKIQGQKNNGYLYNTTDLKRITKITFSNDAANFTAYVGTSSNSETTAVTSGSAISGNNGYFKIKAGSSTATMTSVTIEYTIPQTTIAATINGTGSVDVGTQWSPTNITEDVGGATVSGGDLAYSFAASDGAVISAQNASTGAFTASHAGTVTVSATKTGYTIASKVVTVNSTDPYITLTLNSGSTAYTGQTVDISATYGNGVAGLTWTVESGTITGEATTSNSGYSATIGGNTNSTLTIRAKDTGSALYEEVSVTVTKTTVSLNKSETSIAQGDSETLTATTNVGGVTWTSDNAKVTVNGGAVSVASDATKNSTATITATSNVDGSVSATCIVTVLETPGAVEIVLSSVADFTNAYGWYSWSVGSIKGQTYAYKDGSNIQLGKAVEGFTGIIYNTVGIAGNIKGITITGSGTMTFNAYFSKTAAITETPASGAIATTDGSWTISEPNASEYHYFYLERTGNTGACKATKITIDYYKVDLVDPTGITLDSNSPVSMDTYGFGSRTLSATVLPVNNNNNNVTWETSDSSVVTVSDGVLTAEGAGTATIYAKTANYVSDQATPNLKVGVSVTVSQALYKKATFSPTAVNSIGQSDDYLQGGSATLSTTGTFANATGIQLQDSQAATFTISGYAGMKITGIDLVMSSNAGAGAGSLTVYGGSTTMLSIAAAAFNTESWNGSYSATPTNIYKALTTEHVMTGNETIRFAFNGTVKSIYIKSVSVRYLDYSLEQWCDNFLSQITCTGVTQENPNGAIVSDSNWGTLGTSFGQLSKDLRDIAASANADASSSNVIEQAMARYDLILRKYGIGTGQGQHTDFIGRFDVGAINGPSTANSSFNVMINNNAIVATVVIVSVISLSTLCGYFLLRKRKEER